MKIAIPVPLGGPEPYGFGLYLRRLLAALAKIDSTNEYWIVHPPGWEPDLAPVPTQTRFIRAPRHWMAWQWRNGPLLDAVRGADVVHFTNNTVWFRKIAPTVVTLHDLSYLTAPEARQASGLTAAYIRWIYRKIAEVADRIIADSETTAMDIRTRLGVDRSRIATIPLGPTPGIIEAPRGEVDRVLRERGIDAPYFLYVGAHGPRKNLPRMIEAVARFRTNELFVLTGTKPDAIGYRGVDIGEASWIRAVGYVPAEDLAALYTGAAALLYATFYEGFGLPVLEAFACGCPAIVSNRGSAPEVAGNAALVVDPMDATSIASALAQVGGRRTELVERGRRRLKDFSWDRTAEQTLAVYASVAR